MTCCFFSSLKTLLMPKEPIRAPLGVNVPGLTMAGFQLTLHGRIWVIPEATNTTTTTTIGNPCAVGTKITRTTFHPVLPKEINYLPDWKSNLCDAVRSRLASKNGSNLVPKTWNGGSLLRRLSATTCW